MHNVIQWECGCFSLIMKFTRNRDDFKERLLGKCKLRGNFVTGSSMEYFKHKCAYDSGTFSQGKDCVSDFEVGQDPRLVLMSLAQMDLVEGSIGLGVEGDYPGLVSDNRGFVPCSTAECKTVPISSGAMVPNCGACTMALTCTYGTTDKTPKSHTKPLESISNEIDFNQSGLSIVKSQSQSHLRSQMLCMDRNCAQRDCHLVRSGILLHESSNMELNSNGAITEDPYCASRIPDLESGSQLDTPHPNLDSAYNPTQSLSHPPQSETQSLEPYPCSSISCYAKSMPESPVESKVPLTSSQRSRSPTSQRSKSTSSMHESGLVTGNTAQPHSGTKASLSHMQMSSRTRMFWKKSLSLPACFNPSSFLSTFYTVILLLSVITQHAMLVSAQDSEPAWITQPSDTKITETGTQRIYCRIRNRGARQIAWIQYNEGEVKNLFIDDGRWAAPDHYDIEKKVDGYDLIIRNAQRDDDSDVQCQLQQSDLNKRVKVTVLGEYMF